MNLVKLLFILIVSISMASCGGNPTVEGGEESSQGFEDEANTGVEEGQEAGEEIAGDAVEAGEEIQEEAEGAENQLEILGNSTYYFDYDSSDLVGEAVDLLEKQAEVILKVLGDQAYTVSLSGHTDERGTQEYNLALGARRAESVSRFLRANGVPASNITTTSYGEERPAQEGEGADIWKLNRRVESSFDN